MSDGRDFCSGGRHFIGGRGLAPHSSPTTGIVEHRLAAFKALGLFVRMRHP